MFDIGWSELVVIAVVALIAIGPKELPGVLRMVGQWMGKARKMAAEFQGQFQEAMREAEMADLKKSFDEVKDAATGIASGNMMTSLQKDVSDALQIDSLVKPAETPVDAQVASRHRRAGDADDARAPTPPPLSRPRRMRRRTNRWSLPARCRRRRRIRRRRPADVLKDAKAS